LICEKTGFNVENTQAASLLAGIYDVIFEGTCTQDKRNPKYFPNMIDF